MEHEISPHYTGDGPACTDGGEVGMIIEQQMGNTGCNPAHQVKQQVPKRPHLVFNIVAEDIQGPHIAEQMPEPPVEKHKRKKGKKLLAG